MSEGVSAASTVKSILTSGNLYAITAILGIVLTGASSYWFYQRFNYSSERLSQNTTTLESSNLKRQRLQALFNLQAKREDADGMLDTLEQMNEIDISLIAAGKETSHNLELMTVVYFATARIGILGLIMTFGGTMLYFYRVQLLQDKLLRLQVEAAQRALPKDATPPPSKIIV